MSRSMAIVNTISNVEAIEGKDKIVLVSFLENDWRIIGQKDECAPGKLVVRVEVDALLPIRPEFEFLRKKCYAPKYDRFKIGVMKMAGCISQGILFPMSILPEGKVFKAGDDVTEVLDILKAEDAEDASPKAGNTKVQTPFIKFLMDHKPTRWIGRKLIQWKMRSHVSGNYPSDLISKTDETILQNYRGLLEKYADIDAYFSLKLEGKSSTFIFKPKGKKPGSFFTCSRNLAYPEDNDNEFWQAAKKHDLKAKLLRYYKDKKIVLAIQAELVGPGIQGNIYRLKEKEIRMFTAKDVVSRRLLSLDELIELRDVYGIPMVPILKVARLKDVFPDIETALRISFIRKGDVDHLYEGFKEALGRESWIPDDVLNEGLVIRGVKNEFSFKVRNPQYVADGPTAKLG